MNARALPGLQTDAFSSEQRVMQSSNETLFFGQAGMLDNLQKYTDNRYYQQLCREYSFLKNKFSLRQPEGLVWKSFRFSS